jgi:putative heme transporter
MTDGQPPKASKTQHHPALPSAAANGSGDTDRSASPAKKTRTATIRALAIIAICVGTAAAVYSQRSTIGEGFRNVRDLSWVWVAAASLVEVLSMLALALLYRALLQASQARLTVPWILASSYTANAISIAVPVIGPGMASRQAYLQFREGGADPAAASLTLTLAGIVSTMTLATVATAAAVLSGNPAASAGGLLAAVAMLAAAAAVAAELRSYNGRARLLRLTALTLRCSQRAAHRPKGDAQTLAQAVLASVQRLQLGAPTLARVLLWGLVNWWADVACLAFAMRAAGITGLSAGKILLVWTAGAGAASLSPTPAGIGAVELAMVAALTAAGVNGPHAITAILVYRAISLKGAVTIWALLYRYLHQRRRRTPQS